MSVSNQTVTPSMMTTQLPSNDRLAHVLHVGSVARTALATDKYMMNELVNTESLAGVAKARAAQVLKGPRFTANKQEIDDHRKNETKMEETLVTMKQQIENMKADYEEIREWATDAAKHQDTRISSVGKRFLSELQQAKSLVRAM